MFKFLKHHKIKHNDSSDSIHESIGISDSRSQTLVEASKRITLDKKTLKHSLILKEILNTVDFKDSTELAYTAYITGLVIGKSTMEFRQNQEGMSAITNLLNILQSGIVNKQGKKIVN